MLQERPEKWDWEVSPPAHQAKLKVLTDALERLDQRGLTVAAVIANFHRQRVIPLMERVLLIFKLTPGGPGLGLEDVGRAAPPGHRGPEGEERSGGVPQ